MQGINKTRPKRMSGDESVEVVNKLTRVNGEEHRVDDTKPIAAIANEVGLGNLYVAPSIYNSRVVIEKLTTADPSVCKDRTNKYCLLRLKEPCVWCVENLMCFFFGMFLNYLELVIKLIEFEKNAL